MSGESAERAMEQRGHEFIDKCVGILTEMAGAQEVPQGSYPSVALEDGELDIMGAFWSSDFFGIGWMDSMSMLPM